MKINNRLKLPIIELAVLLQGLEMFSAKNRKRKKGEEFHMSMQDQSDY